MLSDFERKIAQIMRNDRSMGRVTQIADLEQRTGHDPEEIEKAIDKVKRTQRAEGGLQ
ncbi:hypothetical protein [Sporolactobacillus shoreae]|uniref:hypothetical protein n=1 Tax=Sporolactobacillus shoreae TaxID=1465501 RepID=UPI001432B43B|nr:hypothetical protein [Sporolactobacillus shoreae]